MDLLLQTEEFSSCILTQEVVKCSEVAHHLVSKAMGSKVRSEGWQGIDPLLLSADRSQTTRFGT